MELGLGHRLEEAAERGPGEAGRRHEVVMASMLRFRATPVQRARTDRSPTMSTILVTGASGFVGSHLVPA